MPHAILIWLVSTTTTTEWLAKTAHRLLNQDDSCYLYLTSNCCNDNWINKTANGVSSSVDFLVWSRGGNTRMGMFGGRIRLVPNRSFLSLSDGRYLSRVSIGCLVHVALPLSPPYLCRRGPPNSSLAVYWPQYWRSSFSFALCRHPFCLSRFWDRRR